MKKKLVKYAIIIFIILAPLTFFNTHIFYNDKQKVIYNYIKLEQGTFIANCIRLNYKPTDNIENPELKGYGEWYEVHGAKEVLYIAVKPDENNIYKITTVKTNP